MKDKIAVVVTSIAAPNEALRTLAQGCKERDYLFIVIGDVASPADFSLDGCVFYNLDEQSRTGLKLAQNCPTRHYARKNIGYLLAIRNGATIIIETDDDNIPYQRFWSPRQRLQDVPVAENAGWVNTYKFFTDAAIWPRGFALEHLQSDTADFDSLQKRQTDCPIQQGLVNDNPDVDAIYRLTLPLPQSFRNDRRIALSSPCRCPFNSQNTTWFADAFELLYLPAYCSFRMTDIWRSFIAMKIAHLNGWAVLFHEPTMTQKRNEHNLLKDFNDEVPGYLNNSKICDALEKLSLQSGRQYIADNLRLAYEKLVDMSLVEPKELELLDNWLDDIRQTRQTVKK